MPHGEDKIEVENINTPGRTSRVDRVKYEAMREAYLAVLPDSPPGLTAAEAKAKLIALLPGELFPGGEKAGWWMKAVQLDLEAKGLVKRVDAKPLRFHRIS